MNVLIGCALAPVPLVPEVVIYQADPCTGLWDSTGGEYRSDRPPPFWAFAWPGGQALARYLLDHPDLVAGRFVLDLGAGSGLTSIAATRAGATRVVAADIAPDAIAAIARNAQANGATVETRVDDMLAGETDATLILAGDIFYSRAMADRVLRFLRRGQRSGARVLVGDPDRDFLPKDRFTAVASYDVPVRVAVEDVTVKRTTVWELLPVTRER